MQRFSLLQQGDLVKIHSYSSCCFVVTGRDVVKYDWDIQYVMEVRYEHDNYLVVEQVTTNVM